MRYVVHMGVKTNVYTVLVGKPEGNSPPAKPRNIGNIKMDLKRTGLEIYDRAR